MTIAAQPFHLALFATAGVPQIVEGHGIELVAVDGRRYPAADATGFGHDKLIISPPYVISDAEIDTVIERFELALRDARLDALVDA